ncbi:MAG: hypothetical protein ACJAZ0_001096 [Halioglobus sp.]|jgi:hypothetical protein
MRRYWRVNCWDGDSLAAQEKCDVKRGESFDIHDSPDELSGLVAIPLASLKWRLDQRINSWVVTVD